MGDHRVSGTGLLPGPSAVSPASLVTFPEVPECYRVSVDFFLPVKNRRTPVKNRWTPVKNRWTPVKNR